MDAPPVDAPPAPEQYAVAVHDPRLAGYAAVDQVVSATLAQRCDGAAAGARMLRLREAELDLEIAVDRGFDLHLALFRGMPLSYLSPTGLVGAALAGRGGWEPLRSFGAGLLTTCGLEHYGAPAGEPVPWFGYAGTPRRELQVHGRVSAVPARLAGYGVDLEADEPCVWAEGEVRQASLFGECLTLTRRVELLIGRRVVRVSDRVRNEGYAPTRHAQLYHVNLGWPLVAPGARIEAPGCRAVPLVGPTGDHPWDRIGELTPDRGEEVWQLRPDEAAGTAGVCGPVTVINDRAPGGPIGVRVETDRATMPRQLLWKVALPGHYVLGVEPATAWTDPQADDPAARGDLLAPGAQLRHRLEITVLADGDLAGPAAPGVSR